MFLVGDPYKPSFPLLLGGGTTQKIPLFNLWLFTKNLGMGTLPLLATVPLLSSVA